MHIISLQESDWPLAITQVQVLRCPLTASSAALPAPSNCAASTIIKTHRVKALGWAPGATVARGISASALYVETNFFLNRLSHVIFSLSALVSCKASINIFPVGVSFECLEPKPFSTAWRAGGFSRVSQGQKPQRPIFAEGRPSAKDWLARPTAKPFPHPYVCALCSVRHYPPLALLT